MATYNSIKKTVKYAATLAIAGAMTYLASGCASTSYTIKPAVDAKTDESGRLEQRVGIEVSNADKTTNDGFWTISTSPFRPSQWKNHTGRTALVTAGYIGAIYGISQLGGGSKDEPTPIVIDPVTPTNPGTPSTPSTPGTPVTPKPITPPPVTPPPITPPGNGGGTGGDF